MTTVVSRLYKDEATAEKVAAALREQGYPEGSIDVITGTGRGSAVRRIEGARVGPKAAEAYAGQLEEGKALLVARVPFMPMGAALNAIRTVDGFKSIDAGVENQNAYIEEGPTGNYRKVHVLRDSPRFLTLDLPAPHRTFLSRNLSPGFSAAIGTISAKLGLPLLSRHKERRSVISGFMSTRFLPFPLLRKHSDKLSVIPGGGTIFSTALALPLLTRRS